MTIVQVDHVTFGYGVDLLFEDVSFTLAAGERLALVAPNGQGKSSLLRILAGGLPPDEGRVLTPRSVRVGYLTQSHEPDPSGTLVEVLMKPFGEAREARHALTEAEHGAASGLPADLDRLAHAQDHYQRIGADTVEREVSTLATRVGFTDADLERPVASLSGGERGRLQLAAVLAAKPDLLLLDEPTNHLDIESTEWLESFLRGFPGSVVVVSHDRAFLDATCPRTAELGLFKFRLYEAPYSVYLTLREEDLARERRELELQRAEIAKTEDFIRRNLAGQGTNQAKSRRRMLDKLVRIERPEDIWADAKKLGMRFAPGRRSGEIVIDSRGLGAIRGGRRLFEGIDLQLRRLERLAIVGPNGSGKSTLLKRLAGLGDPTDKGEVRLGTNLDSGYFDQHLESLDPRRSCVEEIRAVRPDMVVDAARQYLSRFRFFGDDAFRAVGSLSGGERTRLALARLLLVPRNLLLLDEPTNHLDIPACEILEEALANFDGTVIVVSHDRRFLDRVATRVFHLDDGVVTLYPGTYSDFVSRNRRPKAEAAVVATVATPVGKETHEERRKRSREEERRRKRVTDLERTIAEAEATLATLRAELTEGYGNDWAKLAKRADDERALAAKVDAWTEEWMKLSEEFA